MNAILLCAGFATRMYPLTKDFPKPLLDVGGRPVLDYLVEQIAELQGIRTIHIVTNARFYDHFRRWKATWDEELAARGLTLRLHNDGATENDNRLGAVADLALVTRELESDSKVLAAAGDNIFRFSLKPLWDDFVQRGGHGVVALAERDRQKLRRTGVLELGPGDRVIELHEKPQDPSSTWACPPIYFLGADSPGFLEAYLSRSDAGDAPGNFFRYLVTRAPVHAYKVRGERLDIGSQASFAAADALLRREPAIPAVS